MAMRFGKTLTPPSCRPLWQQGKACVDCEAESEAEGQDDRDEALSLAADVLLALFGDNALRCFKAKAGKDYEPCRDDYGRFASCGEEGGGFTRQERVTRSTARMAKADTMIRNARAGKLDDRQMGELGDHLLSMTAKELKTVADRAGLRLQPGKFAEAKAELVARMGERVVASSDAEKANRARRDADRNRAKEPEAAKQEAKPDAKPDAKEPEVSTEGRLVARSKPRERMDVDDGQRWNEYRVRELKAEEFDQMRRTGTVHAHEPFKPYILEERRIKTEGTVKTESGWEPWQFGETASQAIAFGMGSTDFEEAESVHPSHESQAKHTREVRAADRAAHDARKRAVAAREAVKQYQFESNREFSKKVANVTDDAKVEQIKQRMLKTRKPVMDRLVQEAKDAEVAAEKAETVVNELKQSGPGKRAANRAG